MAARHFSTGGLGLVRVMAFVICRDAMAGDFPICCGAYVIATRSKEEFGNVIRLQNHLSQGLKPWPISTTYGMAEQLAERSPSHARHEPAGAKA